MKFNVTYQTVTPESAEQGDYSDSGFEIEGCCLREAVDLMCGEGGIEASCCPVNGARWITAYKTGENYLTGEETSHSCISLTI